MNTETTVIIRILKTAKKGLFLSFAFLLFFYLYGYAYDSTPPNTVIDLSATSMDNGAIKLDWSSPGDDYLDIPLLPGAKFTIQYSTWPMPDVFWSTSSPSSITKSTSGVTPTSAVSYFLKEKITPNSTYYFKIWYADSAQNWSGISNTATAWMSADNEAPAAVTTLSATEGSFAGQIILRWNASGDNNLDYMLPEGAQFVIGYSTWSGISWSTSAVGNILTSVSTSGVSPQALVTYLASGLTTDLTYYFKVWYADEWQNWSDPSNLASIWAPSDTTPPAQVTDIIASQGTAEGSINLNWSVPGDDGWSQTLNAGSEFWINYSSWPAGVSRTSSQIKVSTSGIAPLTKAYYTLTGLTPKSTYFIGIWYKDPVGNWAINTEIVSSWAQAIPPASVSDFTVRSGIIRGRANLAWSIPGDDGLNLSLAPGSQFRIQYSTFSGISWSKDSAQLSVSTQGVVPGTVVNYTLDSLDLEATYYFAIWHADEYQNWSDISNIVSAYIQPDIAPSAVRDLSGRTGDIKGEIVLNWSVPGDDGGYTTLLNGSQFRIQYSKLQNIQWLPSLAQVIVSTYGTAPGTNASYLLSLDVGTTYYLQIWYADEYENWASSSNRVQCYSKPDLIPPAVVTNLSAVTGNYGSELDLNWSSPGNDGLTGYLLYGSKFKIQYSTFSSVEWSTSSAQVTVSTFGVAPATPISYILSNIAGNTTYFLSLWYSDNSGNWATAPSNITSAYAYLDNIAPAALTGFSASPGTFNGEILLSWNAPGDNGWNLPLKSGSKLYVQYSSSNPDTVIWSTASSQISVSTSGIIPGTLVNLNLTGLQYGSTYYFRAWHSDELLNYSDISIGATSWANINQSLPNQVTDLNAATGSLGGQIFLSWSSPGDDGDRNGTLEPGSKFFVQYSTFSSVSWSTSAAQVSVSTYGVVPGTVVSYTLNNLLIDTSYYISIWYINDLGNLSLQSNISSGTSAGITFDDITANLLGVVSGSVAWGDYDSDSNLDLAISGEYLFGKVLRIYRNTGGNFSLAQTLDGATNSSIAWGDYNNDGYLDLAVCGLGDLAEVTRIYRNDNGTFNLALGTGTFTGVQNGSLAWGDYNNDGYLDLAISGQNGSSKITKIYKNDKRGDFNEVVTATFTAVTFSAMAWGDYNNDGLLDLAISGQYGSGSSDVTSNIYKNNGDDTFTDIGAGIQGCMYSSLSWGDYNSDGYLDLAICGRDQSLAFQSNIYTNNAGTGFDFNANADFPGVAIGSIVWGDYDNDGSLDLAISGWDGSINTLIYRNDGGGYFSELTTDMMGVIYSSLAWGDYNSDGTLDLAVCGYNGSSYISKIYRNLGPNANNQPGSPTGMGSNYDNSLKKLKLTFNAPISADETSNNGLQYEIRVSTIDINTNPSLWRVSATSGKGATPFIGNYPPSRIGTNLEIELDNTALINETTHYWQLRTIDSGFSKSDWCSQQSIYISSIHPPAKVTTLTASRGISENDITLTWGMPGDDGWYNALKPGSQFVVQYSTWSDVEWSTNSLNIISVSTSGVTPETLASYKVKGLFAGDPYYLKIWHMNSGGNWSDLSNSATVQVKPDFTPPSQITNLLAQVSSLYSEINLSWSAPSNDPYGAALSTGSQFKIQYSTYSSVIWSQESAQVTVSTSGVVPGTTVNYRLKNLDYGTTYYVKIWHADEYQNWSSDSNESSAYTLIDYTAPAAVTSLSGVPGIIGGTVKLSWNMPGNDGLSGIFPEGSQFAVQYSTFSGVVWSTAATSQIVFVSTSEVLPLTPVSYTITGLMAENTYYFKIWNFDRVFWSGISNTATSFAESITFEDIQAGLLSMDNSASAWGDYNNDGYLDLAICGNNSGTRTTKIYRNSGTGSFTDSGINLIGADNGSIAWGDYNNDGNLDIAICGSTGTGNVTRIYRNDSNSFTSYIDLTGVSNGSLAWADYNNDGTLDLAVCGNTGSQYITRVYRNDSDSFNNYVDLPGVNYGSLAWGDYNNDGYQDLFFCGQTGTGDISYLYRNYSGSLFFASSFTAVSNGSIALADYNNDGYLDLAICGSGTNTIYRNDAGTFSQFANLTGVSNGSISFGDYDNNGYLDLAVSGDTGSEYITRIYQNNGSSFNLYKDLTGVDNGSLAFGDFDNDGALDLSVSGSNASAIYKNYGAKLNSLPSVPSSLNSSIDKTYGYLSLTWSQSSDNETTNSNGLYYEVRAATVSLVTDPEKWFMSTSNGKGIMPFFGNYSHSFISASPIQPGAIVKLSSLSNNTRYYWQVRSIDTSFAKSAWASSYIDITDVRAPATVTNLSANTGVNPGDINLFWSSPGDDGWSNPISADSQFVIQYSTWAMYDILWSSSAAQGIVVVSTSGVSPSTIVNYTVTGLSKGSTYYLRLWYSDGSQNWSRISNMAQTFAQIHLLPPSVVTDLSAVSGTVKGTAVLSWSAVNIDTATILPLEQGSKFAIKYSTWVLPDVLWSTASAQVMISTSGVTPGTTVSYTAVNIPGGTTYYFKISHSDQFGNWSAFSNIANAKVNLAPAAITTLSALTGINEGEINLVWSSPGSSGWEGPLNDGSKFAIVYSTSYINVINRSNALITISTSGVLPQTQINYNLTGLSNGLTYYFTVWTSDEWQNWSDISNIPSVSAQIDTVIPGQVTDLTGEPGTDKGAIKLLWHTPGDNGDSGTLIQGSKFEIYYSSYDLVNWSTGTVQTIPNVTVSTSGLNPQAFVSYNITGLVSSNTYYAVIRYSDEANNWSLLSNTCTAVAQWLDFVPPASVTSISAQPGIGTGRIFLQWYSPGNDGMIGQLNLGSGYAIQYSSDIAGVVWSTANAQISQVLASTTPAQTASSYILTGLIPGETYYMALWYWDEFNNLSNISSIASSTAQLPDLAAPAKVTNLFGTGGNTESEIRLTWSSPGDNGWTGTLQVGSQFDLYYSTWDPVGWSDTTLSSMYSLIVSTSGVTPTAPVQYTLTGLTANKDYFIGLKYTDQSANTSLLSSTITAKSQRDLIAPSAVTTLSVQTGINMGEVILNWSSTGDDGVLGNLGEGSQFRIVYDTAQYKVQSVSNAQIIISTSNVSPWDPQTHTITGLKAGTTYYFSVWIYDDYPNHSDCSNTPQGRAQTATIPPQTVTDLSAQTGALEGQIKLAWSAPGENGSMMPLQPGSQFRIQYSTEVVNWSLTSSSGIVTVSTSGVVPLSSVSYILTGLDLGATYYLVIWHADDFSNWSNLSNVATTWAQKYDTMPPSPVTDLSASVGLNEGEVILSWHSQGDDGSVGISTSSQFKIQYSTQSSVWDINSAQITQSTSNVAPATLITYVAGNLTPGGTYYFRLWQSDERLNFSDVSNEATSYSKILDIQSPLLTLETLNQFNIRASWSTGTNPSSTQYMLEWTSSDFIINKFTSGWMLNTSSYTALGLTPSTTYAFRIKAKNTQSQETMYSPIVSTRTLVSGVESMGFSEVTYTSMLVRWNTGINPPTVSYLAEWTGSDYGIEASSSGWILNGSSWTATALTPDTTYHFRLWIKTSDDQTSLGPNLGTQRTNTVKLFSISPNVTGNTSILANATLSGQGFSGCNEIFLINGSTIIVPSTFTILNDSGISCTFDLIGQATGYWDVKVATGGAGSLNAVLTGGLRVKELAVLSISPDTCTDTGQINVTISGFGFVQGSMARLTKVGEPDIIGANTIISAESIKCTFDLNEKLNGKWTLIVSTTIGSQTFSEQIVEGFTIVMQKNKSVTFIGRTSGGTAFILPDTGKISIDFPPGCFERDVFITLSTTAVPSTGQSNINSIQIALNITNDYNLQPILPITITMYYRDSDILNIDPNTLLIGRYDEKWNRWLPLPSIVYPDEHKVVTQVTHLSHFAIIYYLAAKDLGNVNVFPNPYNPRVNAYGFTIENLTNDAEVKIFTVSRELVADLAYTKKDGRVVWFGKNDGGRDVASGIYILYVRSYSSGEKKRIKFAIEK
ncbi:MAG: VCBS repeat-containing protein [Elusimicrobia bacterium]|nr:VCBS repeat-containing protein [Elusimicrobiota bacterium]